MLEGGGDITPKNVMVIGTGTIGEPLIGLLAEHKDRFRKDLGNVVEGYQEVARRLGILHEQSNIRPIKFSKPTAVKIKKNK